MATLENAIHALLSADSAIVALCGKRIRPLLDTSRLPIRPLLTYTLADHEPILTSNSIDEWANAVIEVGVYADTWNECAELGRDVQRVCGMVSGITAGVEFAPLSFESQDDIAPVIEVAGGKPMYMRLIRLKALFRIV